MFKKSDVKMKVFVIGFFLVIFFVTGCISQNVSKEFLGDGDSRIEKFFENKEKIQIELNKEQLIDFSKVYTINGIELVFSDYVEIDSPPKMPYVAVKNKDYSPAKYYVVKDFIVKKNGQNLKSEELNDWWLIYDPSVNEYNAEISVGTSENCPPVCEILIVTVKKADNGAITAYFQKLVSGG